MPDDDVPDEGWGDLFSRSDDILADIIVPVVGKIKDETVKVRKAIENKEFSASADTIIVEEDQYDYRSISFTAWIGPDSDRERVTREMPFEGRISEAIIGFRAGTQNAVGVRLEDHESGEKYFPSNPETKFFGAEDFTHPFKLSVDVEKNQEIDAVFRNDDPDNGHLVNCVLTVRGED